MLLSEGYKIAVFHFNVTNLYDILDLRNIIMGVCVHMNFVNKNVSQLSNIDININYILYHW